MTRGRDDVPSRGSDPTLAAPSSQGTQVSLASDVTAAAGSSASIKADSGLPTVQASAYTILGEHGRGGLGRILRARDERTGRVVAIKEMLPGAEDAAPRFIREALVTANLQHPAIVPVYEVGRWPDGQPFYAMKLVAGHTLTEAITRTKDLAGRLALLSHVAAVADALAYAHEAGVIHRDLKPHNVLVGAHGETVVIDWGLAKTGDDNEIALPEIASGETVMGAVMGTPAYMPPEQATGVEVDARADVYAIGAMLYHLLAGVPPYADSRTAAEVITKVREGQPPRALPSLVGDVPQDLAAIVGKSMAHAPEDRYPSASELAADLRTFMTGGLVGAHRYTRRQRAARFVRRHKAAVSIAAVAVCALVGFGAFSMHRIMRERDAAEAAKQESIGRLAISYEQRARTETVSGRPDRALPLIVEAMKLGRDDAATRFVAQRAAEPLPAPATVYTGAFETAQFAPASHDLLIVDPKAVTRWDADAGRVVWRTPIDGATTAANVGSADDPLVVSVPGKLVFLDQKDGKLTTELTWSTKLGMRGITRTAGLVAAVDPDGRVVIWNEATRAQVQTLELKANLSHPAISADGTRIIVGALDMDPKTATSVFEIATGKRLFDLCPVAAPCSEPQYLPDGTILAFVDTPTPNAKGAIMLFDAEGKQRWRHETTTAVTSARVRDGGVVIGLVGGEIRSLDLATGEPRWQRQLPRKVERIRLGTGPLVSHEPKGFSVLSPDGAAELVSYTVDLASSTIAFSADLQRVAIVDYNHGIRVAKLDRPTDLVTGRAGLRTLTTAFSPDGSRVLAGNQKGVVWIHDVTTGALERELAAHERTVASLDIDPAGQRLLTGSPDQHARMWNLATGQQLLDLAHGDVVRVVQFSPDGKRFLTTSKATIARWDAATGAAVGEPLALTSKVVGAAWSPDGRHLAAIDEDGFIGVWNAETGAEVRKVQGGEFGIGAGLSWSPDGRHLAIARHDVEPKLLGVGAADVTLDAGDGGELLGVTVAFDRPGRRLAMAGSDGRVRIWDVATGKRLTTIETGETTWFVAWHPDGTLIATGDRDGTIRVWTDGGDELAQRQAPAEIVALRFSPDGTAIAAATMDQGLVWRVPSWTGSSAELEALARCASGWEIDGDRMVWVHRPMHACATR